jgi:3-hydroxyacyl-CoA dehydrogenase/enoyl-CoA hydratase/3-hydroxybutyryl-CoA epimerase
MSEYRNFKATLGKDGIAVFTWNMPDRSMNVITQDVMDDLDAIIDRVAADDAIKGAVIASGKKDFTGGADITMLAGIQDVIQKQKKANPQKAQRMLLEASSRLSVIYRKLETCGKPFVAAVDGTCMGGGTELALACHGRIAGEDAKIALPEVKIGIFPGAGGTQRVIRMMKDPQAAMQFLLQGRTLDGKKAAAGGLFDEAVPSKSLLSAAKSMLKAGLDPARPWDKPDYRLQGALKVMSPAGFQFWPAANAIYRKETYDNYPGARAIMQSVFEGLQLPMDLALRVESRYFSHVLQTPEAAAMVRSLFVSMQELNKGARRPADVPQAKLKKVGIIGAGFMGAGIAYVTARAGIDVVLIDQKQEAAEKGKSHSEELMKKAMSRGRATQEESDALLARITPTTDYAALKGADLVIEAVFEDRGVKAAAFAEAEKHLGKKAIFASNTSTLPITSLAEAYRDPETFIGIHFFSPVDRMMLVEIILGEKTGDRALATALDYVRAIKKTPIVVNDSRGFFANRCVTAYLLEGHLMLTEGVPPAMIENVARMAGMPVGPLSLNDEVGVDLGWKILKATEADLGEKAVNPAQKALLEEMVVRRERLGRKNGKGFYDYQGRNKALWPGLADLVEPKPAEEFEVGELKHRLLVIQALEAARTFEEGVVTDPREADVGSILGFGFAPYTGGTLSFIDQMGAAAFVKLCKSLEKKHGPRFKPNRMLSDMAKSGASFYGKAGKAKTGRKAA